MWFGNLVTHDWWSLVWLKEGFARYVQYIGTDSVGNASDIFRLLISISKDNCLLTEVEPGFQMDEQFGVATLQSVFRVDSLESSRPLDFDVNNSASLNTLFDVVVYDKGACYKSLTIGTRHVCWLIAGASIVRMMANFLGPETFRRSMTRYLHSR